MLRDRMVTCNYKSCSKQHASSMGLHFDPLVKDVYCNAKCYVEDYYFRYTGRICEVMVDGRRE